MTTIVQGQGLQKTSVLRGTLLISGTCIGGGMIAMPVQTAGAGFLISALVLLASWAFMTFTGLLLLEAALWLKDRTHFSSMAQALLGLPGKALSLCLYLFMNYLSLVAYTSGGAILINHWIKEFFQIELGYGAACGIFTAIFGAAVFFGAGFLGRINGWFSIVMGAIFVFLVGVGLFQVHSDYLAFRPAWNHGLNSFPLILAAFSYQMVVPSVCSYMNYNVKELKRAILLGTSIPCAVYLLWLFVIHGMVPYEGPGGLQEAFLNGSMIVDPVRSHFDGFLLFLLTDLFAFFALVTSFLGLSLALFDFIRDLFREFWKKPSQHSITLLSLIPSLLLAILFPRALLDCLDLSGGFGDSLLSGCIPVAMVWVGRYTKQWKGEYQAPGGKRALVIAGSFAAAIFLVQWIKLF